MTPFDLCFYVQAEVKEFLLALALCHTVQADEKSQLGDNQDAVDGAQEQREAKIYTYQVIHFYGKYANIMLKFSIR